MSTAGGYQILMLEPSAMIRNLVVQVARELRVAHVHQTGNWATARRILGEQRVDCIILSADDATKACELLNELRMSLFATAPDIPVIGLLPNASKGTREALEALGVSTFLFVPFRIRDVFDALGALWPHLRRERLQALR